MVKNLSGGNKHKKQKNHSPNKERTLIIKEEDNEDYGQITTFLGGNMVKVRKIGTSLEYRCKLKKSLPRIKKNDIVLYAIREFGSNNIGDVILLYTPDEVMILKKEKYIIENIVTDQLGDIFSIGDENDEENKENEENKESEESENINIDNI